MDAWDIFSTFAFFAITCLIAGRECGFRVALDRERIRRAFKSARRS